MFYRRFRCRNIESIFGHRVNHGNSRRERVEVTFAFVRGTKPTTRSSCIYFSGKNLTHNSGNGNKRRFIAIVLVVVVAMAVVPSTFSLAGENISPGIERNKKKKREKSLFTRENTTMYGWMASNSIHGSGNESDGWKRKRKKEGKILDVHFLKVRAIHALTRDVYSCRKVFMNFSKQQPASRSISNVEEWRKIIEEEWILLLSFSLCARYVEMLIVSMIFLSFWPLFE